MKEILILILFLTIFSILNAQSKNEYVQMINKFEQWKVAQYKKGTYATTQGCNPDTVMKEGYKGSEMGIPADIDISFTEINGDNKLDALITFNPTQCDGGNALMNAQIRVFILSAKNGYITDDTYIDKIENGFKKGWFNIEKASYQTIYGTYYEYREADGRCCPSVKRPFIINYTTRKFEFENKKEKLQFIKGK